MSRIYDDKALANLPVNNVLLGTKWDVVLPSAIKGSGVILEAVVKGKARYCVTDLDKLKVKYFVLQLDILRSHRRKFDNNGTEIEPNYSDTTKVSTGYLNSSYKTEAKGTSDKLSKDELVSITCLQALSDLTSKHRIPNCISLWVDEKQLDKIDLEVGETIRLKTRGDSPFISHIVRLEGEPVAVSNYAGGDAVGASWTDKIMDMKSKTSANTQQENEIADDEWDD